MNGFIKANLVSLNHVDVVVFSNAMFDNSLSFQLFIDGERVYSPTITRRTTNKDLYLFRLELRESYDFSKRYHLSFYNFPLQIIDVSHAIEFKEFDSLFNYDGDDLGPTYSKSETTFKVWAPLSPHVELNIQNELGEFNRYPMNREDKGVYSLTLQGDYKSRLYSYFIENNGVTRETNDIYAKGVSLNSRYSAVIDLDSINRRLGKVDCANSHIKPTESIIYEVNVRDFTEDKNTDVNAKGKYLGFVEEERKTKGGHPAGLDYLSYLGITHVQLQPIHDVDNVPEDNPKLKYNWGYDPASYFAIEGAYSSHPEIPEARIEEFKTMVNKLHMRNIGVIVDVVYNHCYEWLYSSFEKTVPNYYFREKRDGGLSSCSGCGNDFASERYMARKLIVDSAKYLFEQFDIDGLRFDLMGLLDIKTMRLLEEEVRKIKKDAILYGEGWNMGMQIPEELRASHDNAEQLPTFGFFNDMYRDIIKGPNFLDRITEKGFVNGNLDYCFGLEYIMFGSVLDLSYRHRFVNANQSINYAECHDNNTLFDKLSRSNPDEETNVLYDRVRLANEIIMLSFGVPFYHMGQEVGQSKMGLDNTYNIIKVNNMQWDLVDANFQMVERFRFMCELRKNHFAYLKESNPERINGLYTFSKTDNGLIIIKVNDEKVLEKYPDCQIVINVFNEPITLVNDDYQKILISFVEDNPVVSRAIIPPARLVINYRVK